MFLALEAPIRSLAARAQWIGRVAKRRRALRSVCDPARIRNGLRLPKLGFYFCRQIADKFYKTARRRRRGIEGRPGQKDWELPERTDPGGQGTDADGARLERWFLRQTTAETGANSRGFKCRFAQFPLGHIAMDRGAKSHVLPPLPAHATCLSLAPARPICAWLIENGLASARVKQRPDLAQAEWAVMAGGWPVAGWRRGHLAGRRGGAPARSGPVPAGAGGLGFGGAAGGRG